MEHSFENFFKVWPEAIRKGWTLQLEGHHPNTFRIQAHEKHDSRRDLWAAIFNNVDLNGVTIIVPHYIYRLYERNEL